jgi:hypothetical protein
MNPAFGNELSEKKRKMWKSILISLPVLMLSGCAYSTMSATVSSAKYSDPPRPIYFVVIPSDLFSFAEKRTDKRIVDLIENKMVEHGYEKTYERETATVEVYYKYSIGIGQGYVGSSQDFVDSKQLIESLNKYQNYFQIYIVSIERLKKEKKSKMIWQGEAYGSGENVDIMELAHYFVDVLFNNLDITVANKKYLKRLSW